MTTVLILFLVQGALGAFDTLWHHELTAKLPSRAGARTELALHGAREAIYAVIFLSLGWVQWRGALAAVLAGLLAVEIVITLADFLVEDRTRRLPPSERVLHTLMAVGVGVILAATTPVLMAWSALPTGFAIQGHGLLSWLMSLFGLGVLVWAIRDGLAVLTLGKAQEAAAAAPNGRTALITGATGFIGQALTAALRRRGWRLIALARDPMQARAQLGPQVTVVESLEVLPAETRIDAVVNLAGAAIAGGPWTRSRRRVLLESRLGVTHAVLDLIARLERRPEVLVSASAVGFYGERGERPLDETSGPAPGFMSELCRRWEGEAVKAETLGVRVCRMRLGLVFDRSGGILPALALPAWFGLGAVLGGGRQWMSWIHLDDVLAAFMAALEDTRYRGPINLVAPEQVTQRQFTRALAFTLKRPQWLRVAAWPVRAGLGEMSDLLLASQKVEPARLKALGFTFRRGELAEALEAACGAAKAELEPEIQAADGARQAA